MLYVFGFEKVGIAVSDVYFFDPAERAGQLGAEQGVRVEVRRLDAGELHGSIYSAQPVSLGRPIWRGDFFESVDHPNTFDRAHHHPRFNGWDPCDRHFDKALRADTLGWAARHLTDFEGLLMSAGVPLDEVGPNDADGVRAAVPEIVAAMGVSMALARSGVTHPDREPLPGQGERVGWL